MASGKTKLKKKAKPIQVWSDKENTTSFADIPYIEYWNNLDSTTVNCIGAVRNKLDYCFVEVYVSYKGYFMGARKKELTFKNNREYVYFNVDIDDYKKLRTQLLRGNSTGKAVAEYIQHYDYEELLK